MAGIYLHIPYCKVKCHYCDFHFSTQTDTVPRLVDAMLRELDMRSAYLKGESIRTIYFGGGTPSFLPDRYLLSLMERIRKLFSVEADAEITLECNPDDISKERLQTFKTLGINRFSMGVQSFDNDVLQFMNRAHTASEISQSIAWAKDAGFENITVDLIYGIPGKGLDYWRHQLDQWLDLQVPHLSAYCLTIEPKTYFGAMAKKGELRAQPDEQSIAEFTYLMDFCAANGYEHYEISNFAKPGFISKHNSAYWLGENYLGIGPSAHSYNQVSRGWNVANNANYIRLLNADAVYHETEVLTAENRCNDYLLTRLRTKWGIHWKDLEFIGEVRLRELQQKAAVFLQAGLFRENAGTLVLTQKGMFRADGLAAELFI